MCDSQAAPGPGHYEHTSAFGTQPDSMRATQPRAPLPRRVQAKEVYHLPGKSADGSHRIRVLPSEVDVAASRAVRAGTVVSGGVLVCL